MVVEYSLCCYGNQRPNWSKINLWSHFISSNLLTHGTQNWVAITTTTTTTTECGGLFLMGRGRVTNSETETDRERHTNRKRRRDAFVGFINRGQSG